MASAVAPAREDASVDDEEDRGSELRGVLRNMLSPSSLLCLRRGGVGAGGRRPSASWRQQSEAMTRFLTMVPASLSGYPHLLEPDFVNWLLGRLIFVTTLNCAELTAEAVHVQEAVLRLLRVNSYSTYRMVHAHYLDIIKACQAASDDESCLLKSIPVTWKKQRTGGDDPESMGVDGAEEEDPSESALAAVQLDSDEKLDAFRRHLVSVLAELAPSTARSCPSSGDVDRAWGLAAELLGEADGALLAEGLRWIGSMADAALWPTKTNVFRTVFCTFFDVLESLCSEEAEAICDGARDEVETQAAAFLRVLNGSVGSKQVTDFFRLDMWSFWLTLASKKDPTAAREFIGLSNELHTSLSAGLANAWPEQNTDCAPVARFLLSHLRMEHAEAVAALAYGELELALLAAKTEAVERSKKRRLDADTTIQDDLLVASEESQTWKGLLDVLKQKQTEGCDDAVELALILIEIAKRLCERAGREYPDEHCPSIDLFPRDVVGQFLQDIMQNILLNPTEDECFVVGNRSVHDLLKVQPLENMTQALLQQCVAVATLPWMEGEHKLADLRVGETLSHNLISASGKLNASFKAAKLPRWAMTGFSLAASLEKHVAPKWRVYCLKKAWATSSVAAKKIIVSTLPSWLQCFGASVFSTIKEIVSQALEKEDGEILEPLAKVSGLLICVQSKCGFRTSDGLIRCKVCRENRTSTVPKSSLNVSDVEYLTKFIGYQEARVRQHALRLIGPIANHVGFSKAVAGVFLNYLQDENEDCRIAFSKLIGYLLNSENAAWTADHKAVCDAVMSGCEDFCKGALGSKNSAATIQVACFVLSNLGATGVNELKERVVKLMLTMLLNLRTHIEAFFHFEKYLRANVSESRDIVMRMVALGICNESTRLDVLKHINVLFPNTSINRFLREQSHHIIPHLVVETVRKLCKGNGDSESPLGFVARMLGVKSRHLLAENFQFIFPHMVIHAAEKNEYAEMTHYVESQMNMQMRQLVPSNRQKIITELMSNFHSHPKRVVNAFQWLCRNDDFGTNLPPKIGKPHLVQYLLPKFLGVVGYFDQRLRNPHVPEYVKLEILRSLKDIIAYMGGQSIATVKHKLLSTFKTATSLRISNIHVHVLKLWEAFVKTIDRSALGSILCQVVANFYPHLEAGCKTEALALYSHLIVDRQLELRSHFGNLLFLPDVPELHQINSTIKKVNRINENTAFKDVLYLTTNALKNENSEVKLQALRKLKQLLWPNQDKFQELIVGSERAEPVINRVIDLLVSSTLDADPEVAGLAGDCLGHVGAIDPGRLDLVQDLSSKLDVCLNISEDDFILQLISTLIKSFLKCSESADSDACAYALQEVLKACEITGPASFSSPGGRVWNRLSESEQEVVTPFIASHYCRTEKPVTYTTPIYTSKSVISYEDWLSDWSCHLMSKVKEKKTQEVFVSCKAAIRKDPSCGQFILPYVITSVLIEGDVTTTESIREEINVVVNSAGGITFKTETPVAPTSSQTKQLGPTREQKLALQTVFSIMDHLNKWLRIKYITLYRNMRRTDDIAKAKAKDKDYCAVDKFLHSISQRKLADASFRCGAYARALMHMENHLRKHPDELQSSLGMLQRIYSGLQNPDSVVGAAAVREAAATLEERIFVHLATGSFQDALGCLEGLQKGSDQKGVDVVSSMLECYLRLDRPHTAATLAKGALAASPEFDDKLKGYQLEAAWQLSKWEDIDASTPCGGTGDIRCWKADLAQLLAAAKAKQRNRFFDLLDVLQKNETSSITAAAMEEAPYQRSYEHVVRLQILNEVEQIAQTVLFASDKDLPGMKTLKGLFDGWSNRMTFCRYSLDNQEPILKVRRALFDLVQTRLTKSSDPDVREMVKVELGANILFSAKVARKAGETTKAFNLLIDAERLDGLQKGLFLEWAKLHWARGDRETAIDTLKDGITTHCPWSSQVEARKHGCKDSEIADCASAKLLMARYVDEAANLEAESVPAMYNGANALAIGGSMVDSQISYHMARFYDKVIGRNYEESDLDTRGDFVARVVQLYCNSLKVSAAHIHESLPRLLSLWLDFGARVAVHEASSAKSSHVSAKVRSNMQLQMKNINDIVSKFFDEAPPHYFLLVFPQLTSRICHPQKDVWKLLKTVLFKTFVSFPHQSFWHIVALSKSSFDTRSKRCKEIFNMVEQKSAQMRKFLADGIGLADKLQRLANEECNTGTQDLSEVMPSLVKLLSGKEFSPIMIPTTKNMTVTLPQAVSAAESPSEGNLEFNRTCCFANVDRKVVVMKSLVRPKKVTFEGTDGHQYSFLCKPKDDLRRDCRLIDFNNLLNTLFARDPECRRRGLKIRTYKVIPLNETSGIIEWIENLTPLRNILMKLHKELHAVSPISHADFDRYATKKDDPERNRRSYDELMRRFPPVFAEWFVRSFPDPQSWYLARGGYIATTAAMSMVGYLLGLGDRHAENVMYDASNGDTVHVDLNCLFNKGDELQIPEVVPFRLTHNLVQAMGPTGHEGGFRKGCEAVLGLMRRRRDLLMCALRPFYFDPLVDWVPAGKRRQSHNQHDMDAGNQKAVETLAAIQARLDGLVSKRGRGTKINMPLSVAGQVNHLIEEATSRENLSQMYLGWAAYY